MIDSPGELAAYKKISSALKRRDVAAAKAAAKAAKLSPMLVNRLVAAGESDYTDVYDWAEALHEGYGYKLSSHRDEY